MSNYSWKHNTKLNPYFLLKRNKLKPCIASVRDTNANLVRGVYTSASISMGIRIRPREPCFLDESSEKESSWQRSLFAGAKCVDTPRGLPSAARSCCTFIKMRLGGVGLDRHTRRHFCILFGLKNRHFYWLPHEWIFTWYSYSEIKLYAPWAWTVLQLTSSQNKKTDKIWKNKMCKVVLKTLCARWRHARCEESFPLSWRRTKHSSLLKYSLRCTWVT